MRTVTVILTATLTTTATVPVQDGDLDAAMEAAHALAIDKPWDEWTVSHVDDIYTDRPVEIVPCTDLED